MTRASPPDLIAQREVTRVLASLPEELRAEAEACRIELFPYPEPDDPGDDLLGLFEGLARHEGTPENTFDLPRIRLFTGNLWDYADGNPAAYRTEVRITLLHELGHYLGLDEDDMERLGLD